MLACQFGGAAIAPLLWVPIYQDSQSAALVLAGIPAILAGLVLLVARRLNWAER
jgi:ACDE family multidrug resistance protein